MASATFEIDWPSWEMHPNSDELVFLVSGRVDFVLEADGGQRVLSLAESGAYLVVREEPAGY